MKSFFKLAFLSAIFLGTSLFSQARTIRVVKKRPNKVVIVKPVAPANRSIKPLRIKVGYVWQEGYWKWNKKRRTYVWVNGRVIKSKKHRVWVSGRWTKRGGGYIYVKGHWS